MSCLSSLLQKVCVGTLSLVPCLNGAAASAISQSAPQAQVLPQPVEVGTDAERAELACAALLESPLNPARKVPGVKFEQIDQVRALNVCEEAKNLSPNSPTVSYLQAGLGSS
jgi:hypothetical protein